MHSLREFLDSVSPRFGGEICRIPDPKLDPALRAQRRMAFRNQVHLHVRPSSLTGERLFSCFSEQAPVPVISNEQWWGDSWNAYDYGRDIDFNRPFFEQLLELHSTVPHPTRSIVHSENSDYCNNASGLKNCYLVFSATNLEDCTAVDESVASTDCLDCSYLTRCEGCYDCTLCRQSSRLQCSLHCEQCHDSLYLYNCRSCSDCLFCCNLRNAQYAVFNETVGKAEYQRILSQYRLSSHAERRRMKETFLEFLRGKPHPHRMVKNIEDCEGNYIYNSRRVVRGRQVDDLEDCADCLQVSGKVRSCRDYTQFGLGAELLYECSVCGLDVSRLLFCYECYTGSRDLLYCIFCPGSSNCFGCVGLHRGSYSILNKRYSKVQYDELAAKLLAHMRRTGEWGEFFPMSASPVPYNQTLAQRYFPLDQADAAKKGLWWEELPAPNVAALESDELPDELPDENAALVVKSEQSGRPFSISSHEIREYRRHRAPLPRRRYDERMDARAASLGPLTPYPARSAKTGVKLQSFVPKQFGMEIWSKEEYDAEFA